MSQVLEIHNFGPITDAVLEPGALTVCVGPQATGKSIAAQLLYFFRNLERLILDEIGPLGLESPEAVFEQALASLMGNHWKTYFSDQTRLTYISDQPVLPDYDEQTQSEQTRWEITLSQSGLPQLSDSLRATINWISGEAGDKDLEQYEIGQDIYIPAGRVLYTYIAPGQALISSRIMRHILEWPAYVRHFYASLGEGLKSWVGTETGIVLSSGQRSRQKQEIMKQFLSRQSSTLLQRGELLIHQGKKQAFTVQLQVPGASSPLRLETISSGQMETWPFLVLASTLAVEHDSLFFVFEEPEVHLHPQAQVTIAETIAYLTNHGHHFFITTHSPYILYTINVLLKAHQIDPQGETITKLNRESFLPPQSTTAYLFQNDGLVRKISDTETGIIDEEELETAAAELGDYFEGLLDLEWQAEEQ